MAWNGVQVGGKVYGIPMDSSPIGMSYRTDLFKTFGIQQAKTTSPAVAHRLLHHEQHRAVQRPALWFSDFGLVTHLEQPFTIDDGISGRWMLNTVLYAGVGAAVATLVSPTAGHTLAHHDLTGWQVVFGVMLGAVLLPASPLVMPLYWPPAP
ncbi:hypothetical protein [Streptomyces sp. NPDC020917]|uniref:hypothetical protein n=1 Tax=Streptomyces sp. NPDC020917 TaxID=3365102 RepID=UPI00378CF6A6